MIPESPTYYVTRIILNNVRWFKSLDLKILGSNQEPRKKTIIIGKNGTLKSTFLRCMALGLCDRADTDALLAEPFGFIVSEGATSATIEIHLQNEEENDPIILITRIKKINGKEVVASKVPEIEYQKFFVCGYGAGRATSTGGEGIREYRIADSVYTLFQYSEPLIAPEMILHRLKSFMGENIYDSTMKGLKSALGLSAKDRIETGRGGGVFIYLAASKEKIPLEGWADGFRLTFNWILDYYSWAMRAETITKTGGVKGILLIDELEQHLHPSMQGDLLGKLKKIFPETQIFSTTHSPLVTLGARAEEIVVFKKKKKWVYADENIPDLSAYSAEDVIHDKRLFDTAVLPTKTEKAFKQYKRIMKIDASNRSKEQNEKLKSLSQQLISEQIITMPETPLTMEIDKLKKKFNL